MLWTLAAAVLPGACRLQEPPLASAPHAGTARGAGSPSSRPTNVGRPWQDGGLPHTDVLASMVKGSSEPQ